MKNSGTAGTTRYKGLQEQTKPNISQHSFHNNIDKSSLPIGILELEYASELNQSKLLVTFGVFKTLPYYHYIQLCS